MLPSRGVATPPSRRASIPAVPTSSRWLARRRTTLAAADPRTATERKHHLLEVYKDAMINRAYPLNNTL